MENLKGTRSVGGAFGVNHLKNDSLELKPSPDNVTFNMFNNASINSETSFNRNMFKFEQPDTAVQPFGDNVFETPKKEFKTFRPAKLNLQPAESSMSEYMPLFASGPFRNTSGGRHSLPLWAIDEAGELKTDITIDEVITNKAVIQFAVDKAGCHFLQENYPTDALSPTRATLFTEVTEGREKLMSLCLDLFGNFFIQRIVECSTSDEQDILAKQLSRDVYRLCLDKCACRVIQMSIQKMKTSHVVTLLKDLPKTEVARLCTDQNGNHVIQKLVKQLPIAAWQFLVDYLSEEDDQLISVCEDKYGCRVVQSVIEKLSDNHRSSCYQQRLALLHKLMETVVRNCSTLSYNESANYVVQHVIKAGGIMEPYRDTIIQKYLLCNLLSMSQEKYASHVVEGAFLFAPPHLLHEMMDEVFDGYLPHPETKRDALDILLFHQFGNYIIQQMINICCSAILGQKERKLDEKEIQVYMTWLNRIKSRVQRNAARLERFSSGKKIMETLRTMDARYLAMVEICKFSPIKNGPRTSAYSVFEE